MFVVGLFAGPLIALVWSRIFVSAAVMRPAWANGSYALLLVLFLLVPAASIELRLGLLFGGLLGILLNATPLVVSVASEDR